MKKLLVIGLSLFAILGQLSAQRIVYSEPEREDSRRTEFEIIGKISSNYLVYKNNRNDHAISIYDEDMKLKDRVTLDFMNDRTFNADFVAYQDHFFVIYQYQHHSTVYCMGVKLDANAHKL